jgi:malate dehydrogenase (oxaloacetate-decarboxylating)(NADP+)
VVKRIKRFGLAIKAGQDFDLVNPEDDPRYRSYVQSISTSPAATA